MCSFRVEKPSWERRVSIVRAPFFTGAWLIILVWLFPLAVHGASALERVALQSSAFRGDLSLSPEQRQWLVEHPVLRVANDKTWPPYDFFKDDRPAGFNSDLFALLQERLGIRFEFVSSDDWDWLINEFREKRIDILPSIFQTPEHDPYTLYSVPYGKSVVAIFARPESSVRGLGDLMGRTVAIPKGFEYIGMVKSFDPDISILETKDSLEALQAVVFGKAEASVLDLAPADYVIAENGLSHVVAVGEAVFPDDDGESKNLRLGIRNDWPELLAILDTALADIPEDRMLALRRKWVPEPGFLSSNKWELTPEEKAYVDSKREVTVCVHSDWMPYEGVSRDGGYHGMAADYLRFFSDRLGLGSGGGPAKNWVDRKALIDSGRCDIIAAASRTSRIEASFQLTRPYLSASPVIATNQKEPFIERIEDILSKRIGIARGFPLKDVLKSSYPLLDLVEVEDARAGLIEVESRKLLGFIDSAAFLAQLIERENLKGVKIGGKLNEPWPISIGVRRDDPMLFNIFEKVVASLTPHDHQEIYGRWVSVRYERRMDYSIFWKGLIVVSAVVAGMLFWNRTLAREIRRRKEIEVNLVSAQRLALAASEAKSAFLANMSHEIRTPLNTILGMAYLALNTELTRKQRGYLTQIHKSSTTLLKLINDILAFARVEAGNVAIEAIAFHLDEVMANVFAVAGHEAEEKGLLLTMDVDRDVPRILVGDPLRLGQVMINLVGNAVKFTEKGEVAVSVFPVERTVEHIYLKFNVQDTGIGMTHHQIDHLFEVFTQADGSIRRKFGGAGIGLSVAKKLVNLMGGEIEVESEPQKGSVVSFCVRLGVGGTAGNDAESADGLEELRALMVKGGSREWEMLTRHLGSPETLPDRPEDADTALTGLKAAKTDRKRLRASLDRLESYLSTYDGAAITYFEEIMDDLTHIVSPQNLKCLGNEIQRFDFEGAITILREIKNEVGLAKGASE